MITVTVSIFRKRLAEVLDHVRMTKERVIVFSHDRPQVAVIPLSDLKLLVSSEDEVTRFLTDK
jgi:prevent-host-death family protein